LNSRCANFWETLSTTITWLNEKGTVDVSSVPDDHLEAIKQLERIGVVHKRNNRSYELQKIRLKKAAWQSWY
jgi:hypothetical protein